MEGQASLLLKSLPHGSNTYLRLGPLSTVRFLFLLDAVQIHQDEDHGDENESQAKREMELELD